MQRFQPEAIVCQCGADGLVGDPLGTFNLTPAAYARCVAVIQGYKLPSLYLGGGGYHKANASRCFTTILATLLGIQLPQDIPEHDVKLLLKMKLLCLIVDSPSFSITTDRDLR